MYDQFDPSQMFMSQNLGLMPQQAQPMPPSAPNPQMQHLGDVINQYVSSKQDQQNNSGLVQQILSNRMQPSFDDASKSTFLNAISPGSQYTSPDQVMADRYKTQLAPYTEGLGLANQSAELSGRLMQNNITQQTGLPMAQAQLQQEQMKNDIMAKTGMSSAQADIALKNSQAGYYSSALQRDLAEKQFDYQNNPQMGTARLMNQYLQQMSGTPQGVPQTGSIPQMPASDLQAPASGGIPNPPSPQQLQQGSLPQQMQQNQSRFNPMGAMLAKQFGMENMQIGANGQPEPIPGMPTVGQKEIDKNFADSLQTYANAGGATRTQNAIDVVDQTIKALQSGQLSSGGMMDRLSMEPHGEPSRLGMIANSPILVARSQIANAILPQAKSLFGSRVTNFDAQSLINSQGLDPLAPPETNIQKLERLKSALISGQQDLINGGQYFTQHGTLSGYQSPALGQQPTQVPASQPNGSPTTIQDGATATNPQTGQKVIYKNGQWSPL